MLIFLIIMNKIDEAKDRNKNEFQLETKIVYSFIPKGVFILNNCLFIFYNENIIKFYSIKNFLFIFEIEEYFLNNIAVCKKHKEDSILVISDSFLYFILIIENCEYIIKNQIDIKYSNIYAFNSSFDLLTYDRSHEKIFIFSGPNYKNTKKFSTKNEYYYFYKVLFFDDKKFLGCENDKLGLYELVEKKSENFCLFLYRYKIKKKKNYENYISVIDLNKLKCEFYAFIIHDLIYLINKDNYIIAKTIKLNQQIFDRSDIFQIYNNNIDFLLFGKSTVFLIKYEISMGGIKWQEKSNKIILQKEAKLFDRYNNIILFVKDNNCFLIKRLNN